MIHPFDDVLFPEARELLVTRMLEARYLAAYGTRPYNISSWNVGSDFAAAIEPHMVIPHGDQPFDYIFPDELVDRAKIGNAFSVDGATVCVTPSATSAQVLVAGYLHRRRLRNVYVVNPHYFAARLALELFGLQVTPHDAVRKDNRFQLSPFPPDMDPERDAIWLTDPLFPTGSPWSDADRATLLGLARQGFWLVLDQSLCQPGHGLHQHLGPQDHVLSIHSPHKLIGVNAMKFGAVLCTPSINAALERWADVLCGGLNVAHRQALSHFLSPHYGAAVAKAVSRFAVARAFVSEAIAPLNLETDKESSGPFVTCYIPSATATFLIDAEAQWRVINESGVLFFTGGWSHMPNSVGWSFRINLARDGDLFRGAVIRLSRILSESLERGNS